MKEGAFFPLSKVKMDKNDPNLARLLDSEDRVVRYPSKLKQRVYAIAYIGEKFEADKIYKETEINAVIRGWISFDDYVMIRRDLVNYHFLDRTPDGSAYHRAQTLPSPEDILKLY